MFSGVDLDGEGNEEDQPRGFQVNVTVLEGRHLAVINGDSRIAITLGRRRRTSRSKTLKTDCPYFNEFFFFGFHTPLSAFLGEILRVELYRVRRFKSDKLIGGFSVELATVWLQPNHLFRHKWAVLTDPNNPTAGVKGYLKCDIAILGMGSRCKPVSHDLGEKIEDHLMVPRGEVEDRQRAKFVFSIFRADNFSPRNEFPVLPDPYVTVTFGGVSRRTSVEKKTETPLWNQELVFVDMIPTLYQYVRVEVCDASRSSSKRVLGGAQLDLREISHESDKGFLPTYGPSFLYFYKNLSTFELHNKCCSLGNSCTYVGRLLLALRTEIVDYAEDVYVGQKRAKKLSTNVIPPLMESRYFDYKEFVFFASVFDVLLFNRRLIGSKISVRVTIGPIDSTLKAIDEESEVRNGEKDKFPQEKPRARASPRKKKMESEKSWETNENDHSQTFPVQGEKESVTVQNSKPIREGRSEILRLPKKGFVYMDERRETIRQMKFFKSLDEWPDKEITRENFANFRSCTCRRKKIPDENSTVQSPSSHEASRLSKHYRRMKSTLAGEDGVKTVSKCKYLRIKNLFRRVKRESRFASNAHTETDDGDARNGTKRSRPRISKLKEWTGLKEVPTGRTEEQTQTPPIRARKPKSKKPSSKPYEPGTVNKRKLVPVNEMNWENSFRRQQFSWDFKKARESDSNRESEALGTKESSAGSPRKWSPRSGYAWLTCFSPRERDSGGSSHDLEKVPWTVSEEMRRSSVKRISRRRKKSRTEGIETSDMSPNSGKGAKMPDHNKHRYRTIQRAEHFTEPQTNVKCWRRNGGGALTGKEESESPERNLKLSANAWKSLTERIREKFSSKRGRAVTSPELRRKTGKKLWDEDGFFGIFGKWPENGTNCTCKLDRIPVRSSLARVKRNVERKKLESTKMKIRRFLTRGSKERAKSQSHLTGKGEQPETRRENSGITENDKFAFAGEKSLPPKRITSTSSCVMPDLRGAAKANRRKVRRARRTETSKIEDEDSTDESNFDFEFVRCPWQRERPQIVLTGATVKRRKRRSRDFARLCKGTRERFADPVDCDADDECKESESTSDDSNRLYTRPKRYYKRKSSRRWCKGHGSGIDERDGASNANNLLDRSTIRGEYEPMLEHQTSMLPEQDKAKMQKKSPSEEATRRDFVMGGQKNYFVFYSLQKGRPIVSRAESQFENVGKRKEEGDDKSATSGSDQELVVEDSREKGSELENGKMNRGQRNSVESARNVRNDESDGRSSASGDETAEVGEGSGEKTNSFGKRSAEFPAGKTTSGEGEERGKPRERKSGKNGAKSRDGKPGGKRNEKRKRKTPKGRKTSDEEREKMTNGIRHLNVYNDCNTTDPQSVKMLQHYGCSNFSGKFPCLHVVGSWPDARRRMYRTNIVENSIKTFTAGIREVEDELRSENKIEASTKMKSILASLSKDCREILRLTERVEPEDTNLWREKKKFYHREIREIIFKADTAAQRKVLTPEDELNRSYNYLATIRRFAQGPEDSFPDTEIWLLKNKQSVAQYRMRTRKLVYSRDAGERGSKSGRIQSIVFRGKDGGIMAKLEMFMWFGLGSHFEDCKKMLPPGFEHSGHLCPGTDIDIPETLRYQNFLFFQCRIYVSQAVILQHFDATGFADPFVRIVLDGRCRDTQTLTTTLNPIWNEMLVFPDVKIHWPPVYVKDNSIAITVEVFDFHFASPPELIGRTVIKPAVKLANGESSSPDFPIRFSWKGIRGESNETGKILIAAELLERNRNEEIPEPTAEKAILPIPKHIRPSCVSYRLEVLFWGVRELSKKYVGTRCKAYVALECAGKVLTSPSIKISGEAANFAGIVQTLDLELPREDEYKPPLIMKLIRTNAMRGEAFMGKCIIPNVKAFFCPTVDDEERIKQEIAYKKMQEESMKLKEMEEREAREMERKARKKSMWKRLKLILLDFQRLLQYLIVITYESIKSKMAGTYGGVKYSPLESGEREPLDWWMKYYASKYETTGNTSPKSLVIYDEELEAQPEFGGFSDYIYTFNVTAGKMKKKAEKEIFVGKVKAAIKLYRWPLEEQHYETLYGVNIRMGLLRHLPSNTAIKFIVRAYVISCRNLTPKDIFGKSDPYLLLKLGKQKISDSKNYIPKDVNPTFGKCFEFVGIFPKEHLLSVRVMDHRTITSDDLIGETRIDLESRYYTKHHASCGVSATYSRTGYNFWRDAYRPTELLKSICKRSHLSEPVYTESAVIIDEHKFQNVSQDNKSKTEAQALNVLHKWHEIPFRGFHLVPEHVETRALYHPSYPGIEQGRVEMWIDIFPADFRYIPPVIDVTPRKPVDMELRAIVWNVENVTLSHASCFTGERMSDILVEGWLSALKEDRQATDVHYRSVNGHGNFNWRFIFPFKYAEAERRMVIQHQDPFHRKVEETKYPCRLELHVLDNDLFKQDFLGSLNLELCSMPRGAKISTQCDLSMLEETTPKIDLFKIRRTRGWWPFKKVLDEESAEYKLAGKVELELEVLTEAEAVENPAGKGREEPRALPQPKRPDTSLFWLTSPMNTFRHIIFRKFGKYIALVTLTALLVLFFGLGIYSIPGYTVKKLLGA